MAKNARMDHPLGSRSREVKGSRGESPAGGLTTVASRHDAPLPARSQSQADEA